MTPSAPASDEDLPHASSSPSLTPLSASPPASSPSSPLSQQDGRDAVSSYQPSDTDDDRSLSLGHGAGAKRKRKDRRRLPGEHLDKARTTQQQGPTTNPETWRDWPFRSVNDVQRQDLYLPRYAHVPPLLPSAGLLSAIRTHAGQYFAARNQLHPSPLASLAARSSFDASDPHILASTSAAARVWDSLSARSFRVSQHHDSHAGTENTEKEQDRARSQKSTRKTKKTWYDTYVERRDRLPPNLRHKVTNLHNEARRLNYAARRAGRTASMIQREISALESRLTQLESSLRQETSQALGTSDRSFESLEHDLDKARSKYEDVHGEHLLLSREESDTRGEIRSILFENEKTEGTEADEEPSFSQEDLSALPPEEWIPPLLLSREEQMADSLGVLHPWEQPDESDSGPLARELAFDAQKRAEEQQASSSLGRRTRFATSSKSFDRLLSLLRPNMSYALCPSALVALAIYVEESIKEHLSAWPGPDELHPPSKKSRTESGPSAAELLGTTPGDPFWSLYAAQDGHLGHAAASALHSLPHLPAPLSLHSKMKQVARSQLALLRATSGPGGVLEEPLPASDWAGIPPALYTLCEPTDEPFETSDSSNNSHPDNQNPLTPHTSQGPGTVDPAEPDSSFDGESDLSAADEARPSWNPSAVYRRLLTGRQGRAYDLASKDSEQAVNQQVRHIVESTDLPSRRRTQHFTEDV